MKRLVFALCLAAIAAAAAEDRKDRVLRRLEAVKPANVRLAWEDMARRWPDRFEANPKWLQTFGRDRKRLMNAIMGDWGPYYGELPPVDGGEKFLADLRARLLQNPLLDCDRLLAIRRRQNALGRDAGDVHAADGPGGPSAEDGGQDACRRGDSQGLRAGSDAGGG